MLTDGVEEWWDDVEIALDAAKHDYPILDSVSPYGELVVAYDRLSDLADECRLLAEAATGQGRELLLKIAGLCDRATLATDSELRFNGD